MKRPLPYEAALALIFGVLFIGLAIEPVDRTAWLLENALTALGAVVLIASHRRFPLSVLSYTLIFAFACLHVVGAHYTYSEVPYRAFFEGIVGGDAATGVEPGRNHFDRFVHFMYGLLLAYPIREIFLRVADVRGFWGYFLPLDLAMSSSMLYELIEWGAAVVFGGDLGIAYLGTQGDVWDAHKDMALASLGALIAMAITLVVNRVFQRDFNREWAESLRVKHTEPLGEVEIRRILDDV